MTVVSRQRRSDGGYVERATPGGGSDLADVVELILDRGLVIDVFARVSLVGIELLTIDARIVVASVDTYLRFAEATNRLDLTSGGQGGTTLPELIEGVTESGTKGKASGAIESVADNKVQNVLGGGDQAGGVQPSSDGASEDRASGEQGEPERPELDPGEPARGHSSGEPVSRAERDRREERRARRARHPRRAVRERET